jgi:hypothetical protein
MWEEGALRIARQTSRKGKLKLFLFANFGVSFARLSVVSSFSLAVLASRGASRRRI